MSGYNLLHTYIRKESILRQAIRAVEIQRELIYARLFSQSETSLGFMQRSSLRIEPAVIELVTLEESLKKEYAAYYKNRKRLNEVISILSSRELQAYNAIVWGEPCNIAATELKAMEKQITSKLITYIESNNLEKGAV